MTDIAGPIPRRSVPRAAGRAVLVAAVVGIGSVAVHLLTALPGHSRTRRGTHALHLVSRLLLCVLGIRVINGGNPRSGPSLVVANHVSWIDVLAVHAAGPMLPVARAEVGNLPVVGEMFTRVGAVFVREGCRRELPGAVDRIADLLRRGHRVQVFPECDSSSGSTMDTFRRAAFQAAVDSAVVISPVSVSHRAGRLASSGTEFADDVYGSLWRVLRDGPVTVRTHWLPVIPAVVGAGHRTDHRAAAAARAERAIAADLGEPTADRRRRLPALVGSPPELRVDALRQTTSREA